jgi:molybdopterin synthase catalytic subunit
MIRVTAEPFDPAAALARFGADDTGIGGIASFIGLVRGNDDGKKLVALTLEHYPGMTEKKLREIEDEARRRWALGDVLIIHRHGRMVPGEAIVLVATSSSHRRAALESCQFLIDWLKTDAPFWKFEETEESGGNWVEARASDAAAAERWR